MWDLETILKNYGIDGKVVGVNEGPIVKQIEFLPAAGTKVKNVVAVLDDIAREMGVSSLRVEPVEGTNNLGFEIPQDEMQVVDFKKILDSEIFDQQKGDLPLCLGVDIKGEPFFADLAKMPHLLVAGTTGSGKSVGLNTFILSLIKLKKPQDLKFVLIDPKRIEFSVYNNQKYMLMPVVTDNEIAVKSLEYLVGEMNRRYALLEENMAKNVKGLNEKSEVHLPYIVCVIDEFSDLVMSEKGVEKSIIMLAQKARAAGIHIILATQRPSVDVVTGVLKANFPIRMSYKVASSTDSRTVLDATGAEKLIGRGDALFLQGNGDIKRLHGAYMSDSDIEKMLEPYRGKVKPFIYKEEKAVEAVREKKSKSMWKRGLEAWSNLRQKDKKTLIAGATAVVGYLWGKVKKK